MNPSTEVIGQAGAALDWGDPSLWPDVTTLVTEDDTPVDNPYSEKQMRLLTEPLYASWPGPGQGRPFRVLANVGLYYQPTSPLVPDVMLGLDVRAPNDLLVKGHRAWFVWIVGKQPDAVIEIVSNTVGGEDTSKMIDYATCGVRYYIIHDPLNKLRKGVLRAFDLGERVGGTGTYTPTDPRWLDHVSLGLTLWRGKFEDIEAQWLRWCDRDGQVIPTGIERAEQERQSRVAAELQSKAERQARVAADLRTEAEHQARIEADLQAEAERQARITADLQAEAERQARITADLQAEAERQARMAAEARVKAAEELIERLKRELGTQ